MPQNHGLTPKPWFWGLFWGVPEGSPRKPLFFHCFGTKTAGKVPSGGYPDPEKHVFSVYPRFRPRFRVENGGVVLPQFPSCFGCKIWGGNTPQNAPEKGWFLEKTPPNMIYRNFPAVFTPKKSALFGGVTRRITRGRPFFIFGGAKFGPVLSKKYDMSGGKNTKTRKKRVFLCFSEGFRRTPPKALFQLFWVPKRAGKKCPKKVQT